MEIIFNKTALKLLSIVFENPLQEFKEIELINKANTGKGASSVIINKLAEEKIISIKRKGKLKIITLNFNPNTFLLKRIMDQTKLHTLNKSKLTSIYFLKDKLEDHTELIILFGSTIDKTDTTRSDIDILLAGNPNKINEIRKITEELFGERFNLHIYKKDELMNKINEDTFIKNVLLKGVVIYGYTLASQLFIKINKNEINLERLIFFKERIKAISRNYENKDYKTAKDILEKTLEQIISIYSQKKILHM